MTDVVLPGEEIQSAVAAIAPGRYGVAVSGGADSIALLLLLHRLRTDLPLVVLHLDHQTRQGQSTADARFVSQLADQLNLLCDSARLDEVESQSPPPNKPARYRAARLLHFAQCADRHQLDAVLLAHHADDQAESILIRLLRGNGPEAIAGMPAETQLGRLKLRRPLLAVRRQVLRCWLTAINQSWCEDQSNHQLDQQRNRLRAWLAIQPPSLMTTILRAGSSSRRLMDWLNETAPSLDETFSVQQAADLPDVLARHSLRGWLAARGAPPREINQAVCDRLLRQLRDSGTAAVQMYPGQLRVRRTQGMIRIEPTG